MGLLSRRHVWLTSPTTALPTSILPIPSYIKKPNHSHRALILICAIAGLWILRGSSESTLDVSGPSPPPRQGLTYNSLASILFPVLGDKDVGGYIAQNHEAMGKLFDCIERRECERNQTKVVILNSPVFFDELNPWTISTITSLQNLGYTYLFARTPTTVTHLYRTLPTLVSAILLDPFQISECLTPTSSSPFEPDDEKGCLLSAQNPHGLPVWKLFSVSPPEVVSVLAPDLKALSRDRARITSARYRKSMKAGQGDRIESFVGYSREARCRATRFVPHDERHLEAYVLRADDSPSRVSGQEIWAWKVAAQKAGVSFVTHARPGEVQELGVNDLGLVKKDRFLAALAQRRVLVGDGGGSSLASTAPYDALCLGIPFINPILSWDPKNPKDRTKWVSQHAHLASLDPPYVYNVPVHDNVGFAKAIEGALENPIESFVLEGMYQSDVDERLGRILGRDWEAEARMLKSLRGEDSPYIHFP